MTREWNWKTMVTYFAVLRDREPVYVEAPISGTITSVMGIITDYLNRQLCPRKRGEGKH